MSNFADNVNMNIDLTEVQEFGGNGGPPVPPGEYAFTITGFAQAQSKANQPTIKVTAEVLEPAEHAGKKLLQSYSLQPQALGRIKKLGMAVGAKLTGINSDDYLNQSFRATVTHRPGQAQAKPDGTLQEPMVFCSISDERPMDDGGVVTNAAPPPITRGRAAPPVVAAKTNGQPVRRA